MTRAAPIVHRFAGTACLLAVLVAPAAAGTGHIQASRQLEKIRDIVAALQACWVPPPLAQAQQGMQITVRFSFTRDGGILGEPRFTYVTPGVRQEVRTAYERAAVAALNRCTPLPFSPALGAALAGQPFAIRFVDNRNAPGA